MATETSVEVYKNQGIVQGQPQAYTVAPDDGLHHRSEVVTHTDVVILDPNHELAVQVPEDVGASTVGVLGPLGDMDARHPEDMLAETADYGKSKKS